MGFQSYKSKLLFQTPESYVYSLFGSLMAPIFNRSAIRTEFRAASARQLEAIYSYQKVVVGGYIEVYNQLAGIRTLEEVLSLKWAQANALALSIDASSELFLTGRANYLEVIVTQQNALDARLDPVNVKRQQLDATVNLYKILGGGWR